MATEEFMREPPPPPPDQPMDLSAVQAKITEAFKSGNFSELARLNALAREISNRLTMSTRTDDRFKRVQMNPDAASDADRAYADSLIRNLGAARQMVESTQRASEVEDAPDLDSPGPSVGEEVAGTAGALGAADVAGRAASSGAVGRSQAAATGAKKALEQGARIATDRAVAERFAGYKPGGPVPTARAGEAAAKATAQEAADRVGTARTATKRAVKKAGKKGAQKAVTNVRAQQLAAEQASKAARQAVGPATQAIGEAAKPVKEAAKAAATKRATARGFAATAARAAPRIFGAMPLALAEVAIAPIAAFYKTTEQTKSFLGRLEKLAEMKGGPLGVDDLNTDTLDVLSTSPTLVDSMLKSGVIDNTAYAFANPEGAAEMGLSVGDGDIQRGGDIFTVGDVEGARAAEPGEDFGRRDPREIADAGAFGRVGAELQAKIDAAPKKGEPGYIGRIGEDDSTPVARKKAAARAFTKSRAKPKSGGQAQDPYSMEAITGGPKKEGDLPTFDEPKKSDLDRAGGVRMGEGPAGREMARIAAGGKEFSTPKLAPPKERKLGKGLQKLLETFSTMDIGKSMPDDLGV